MKKNKLGRSLILMKKKRSSLGQFGIKNPLCYSSTDGKKSKNRSVLPAKHKTRKSKEFKEALAKTGYETSKVNPTKIRTKKRMREDDSMDVDGESPKKAGRTLVKKSPHQEGLRDAEQKKMAKKLLKLGRRPLQMEGRAGTSDRKISEKLPKHLFSGKRGIGKTQRR
mmetsp:Transcript_12161/g.15768  ORF Transcript_12161/g.15768 Transcript_12161/m.15768 type:complete len:167 (+) Transcript_12161:1721-2221(+)